MMRDESLPKLPYAELRRDYMQRGLDEADLHPDPLRQFTLWFQDALNSKAIA